jgi:hypothetical protein
MKLSDDMSKDDLERQYVNEGMSLLEKEDIQAVLEFAAAQSDHVMLRAG